MQIGKSSSVLVAIIVTFLAGNSAQADQSPKKSIYDIFFIPSSHCITVLANLVQGAEDPRGEPFSLRFIATPEDQFLHSTSDRLSTIDDWRDWNRVVTSKLSKSFSSIPDRINAGGKLALAKATFTIGKDGTIKGIAVDNLTEDPKFTAMVNQAIMSLEGDDALRFPKNSTLNAVRTSGRFIQNSGTRKAELSENAKSRPELSAKR